MKIYLVLCLVVYQCLLSQQIHVQYFHVRSPVASLKEDLYIDGNKVLSRQDSIVQFNNLNGASTNIKTGIKNLKNAFYFISNLKETIPKDFFFNSYIKTDSEIYFIHDEVTKPDWKIDEKQTKKILGYTCFKATTNFRGTDITAFFTKDLPYSASPFKFHGLPGLILDVRENNKGYNIWKAEKIDFAFDHPINMQPEFPNYPKLKIRDFVKLKDQNLQKSRGLDLKSLPSNVMIDYQTKRIGIEQKYEWEN